MDAIYQQLKQFGKVKPNEPLAKHTTFKIGGQARFLVIVEDREQTIGLLNFLSAEGINYFILGGGSNLLFSDDNFDGVIIKVTSYKLQVTKNVVEADAGVPLAKILNITMEHGLSGMEWSAGVPGTIGGAARGNAGAFGSDIASNVDRVEVWRNGEVIILSKEECNFGYRSSGLKKDGAVILSVWFKFPVGNKQEIMAKVQKNLQARQGKFPPFPSAGCFFKNIKLDKWPGKKEDLPPIFLERGTVPAGWLVEQAGIGGLTVGGAKVDASHCNFVVNVDKATQSDVLKLVEIVKEKVYNKFGVELEQEVEVVE
ncbi:MAG: UDP-N-acetylenolpyruvoylglucosamine reductase [Candidatus Magasanikbacteria bacterium RIFCSPLOWO2_01_FULL_43_20b]|uniref:UDP-N-acetylenolpyruvoylglucosamine reductase n=1 Tax=Candidatus Magasanikbacteria bacterium RIFCSPLOWO2_12_FULL_43_12 TaxID=1798692 RepID=A0A1F6MS68_9BACT|nr:MAG: UDP-N-acetylenolpyruvoylglucosamine reductase [Candidatus Magasanikbacteria bacterium RIFCSPLOWO2_02_FULL_43_22]OGH73050.1 MAG: UDP-N-acetylenolpyruvoylglucosamine reductase [Candidatus Magasanikbacteria bacterium RIFCSPLOWO2_01_FULL_43_20b]OGH74482.1 MAG: UDP-N-acetylenolpyruvoylglucosamine reductase [Candidatus Magasanikbacteria bacterium RIFCSPLOWO2_12_FULL_43_12]